MIKGILFDFNKTLYDPELDAIIDDADMILQKLKNDGYQLCLISKLSQKSYDSRAEQISQLGLDRYFIDIQIIEGNKTEEHFQRCVRIMSLNPSEIAVVGDRIREEITLGNRLGMRTIWYKNGKFSEESPQSHDEKPQHTITSLKEIYKHLI